MGYPPSVRYGPSHLSKLELNVAHVRHIKTEDLGRENERIATAFVRPANPYSV